MGGIVCADCNTQGFWVLWNWQVLNGKLIQFGCVSFIIVIRPRFVFIVGAFGFFQFEFAGL